MTTADEPPPKMTDEELAGRVARPRQSPADLRVAQDACQELYRRHARSLLAFLAGRAARSDLEDLHHGVWIRVWEHLPTRFDGRNFRAWLYQIARNHLIDEARRKRAEQMDEESDPTDEREGGRPLDVLLDRERRRQLEECLGKLDATLAALVKGRLSGESYEELCPRLNLEPARAHRLFHTAKEQLQNCVNRNGP